MDVARRERLRDAAGNYWCIPCASAARGELASPDTAAMDNVHMDTLHAVAAPVTAVDGSNPAVSGAGGVPAPALPPLKFAHPRELGLVSRVTCPHCWNKCRPQELLWIAQHEDLLGDPVLGPEKHQRFLPTRFNVEGQALDARGTVCTMLACPRCHLNVPRALLESELLFVSLVGGPGSGKSYFLTSMAWELRRILPSRFAVAFSDADLAGNRALNEHEDMLFLADDPNTPVAIQKTELQGEGYDQISIGTQAVSLPRPLLFHVRPAPAHPMANIAAQSSRVICLYDNAGEHFQPGMDTTASPVTQHLAESRVLMFVFDPTQDPRFRERCKGVSDDPQLSRSRSQRQETLLNEMAQRIRRFANLPEREKTTRPLMVLVSKSDTWEKLINIDLQSEPVISRGQGAAMADIGRMDNTSAAVRQMLAKWLPELVSAAEDFSEHVVYIPVSALGHSPEVIANTQALGIRPSYIQPHWVTAPLLYLFAKWTTFGLIRSAAPGEPAPGARV